MRFSKIPFSFLLLSLLSLGGIGCYAFFKPQFVKSYPSPDKQYSLEVYAERRLFAMPGDGGGSMAIIFLKKGWRTIATVTPADDCCSIRVSDVSVDWNLKDGYVRYGMARMINLKTGKFD